MNEMQLFIRASLSRLYFLKAVRREWQYFGTLAKNNIPKYKMAYYTGTLFIHLYDRVWGLLIDVLFPKSEKLQDNK